MTNDVRQVVEQIERRFRKFSTDGSGPDIPDAVPLACDLERVAEEGDVTVGDLRALARELRSANEAYARLGAKRIMENGELVEQLESERIQRDASETHVQTLVALVEKLKASTPSPSGWQQRIAARKDELLRLVANLEKYLHPAGEGHRYWRALKQALADAGQHAKDALPPSSSEVAEDALDDIRHHLKEAWGVLLFDPTAMPVEVAKTAVTVAREQIDLALKLLPRVALPPVPEASPATRSVQDDLLDAMERMSKRDDMSAAYRRDVPILIRALRLARERAVHGDENEKPWRFCPWCGEPTGLHLGDPTMNCGRDRGDEERHD